MFILLISSSATAFECSELIPTYIMLDQAELGATNCFNDYIIYEPQIFKNKLDHTQEIVFDPKESTFYMADTENAYYSQPMFDNKYNVVTSLFTIQSDYDLIYEYDERSIKIKSQLGKLKIYDRNNSLYYELPENTQFEQNLITNNAIIDGEIVNDYQQTTNEQATTQFKQTQNAAKTNESIFPILLIIGAAYYFMKRKSSSEQ